MQLKKNIEKYIKKSNVDDGEVEQTIWKALRHLLFSFLIVLIITAISPLSKELQLQEYVAVLVRNTVIFYVIGSFLLLFKRGGFYFSLYSVAWIIVAIANALVTKFRGTPMTKYDFLMIKEGFSLSKDFMSGSDFLKIGLILTLLIVVLVFMFIKSKGYQKLRVDNWAVTIGVAMSMFSVAHVNATEGELEKVGFVSYLTESLISKEIKKPKNYSEAKINDIKNQISNSEKTGTYEGETPNIVAIQLESFFDPKDVEGLDLNKNPLPYFDELKEKFSHGYVTVPTFGGGTAMSEYEFLTTMDLSSFNKGVIPHNTFLKSKVVPTIPYMLKNNGYRTHFIHNYLGDFYNRDTVYKNLGFDTFTSKELIYYSAWDPLLIKASNDNVFIKEVSDILSQDENKDFVFGVTAQLHGPYYDTYTAHENGIYATGAFPEKIYGEINEYVNKINTIDNVIKELVEKVESINEPTIIIFYSDHLPPLDFSSTNIEESKYKTPYLVWDNIGLEKEVKNLNLSDLLLETLTKANIDIGYLTDLYNTYSGEKEYKEYKELLNYDVSFGENYLSAEKFKKINTKIGNKNLQVSEGKKTGENEYTITGWNYTEYVKLVCDKKEYEIEYVGPGEIKIKTSDNLVGKEAHLEIAIGGRRNSVAKSRNFTITE